jgi:hypothetical protein
MYSHEGTLAMTQTPRINRLVARRIRSWVISAVPALLQGALAATLSAGEPIRLRVDFSQPDGAWDMPALALGQGGLQADPMLEPHVKEIRPLRPRTIRLFLSEYYRIYPAHDTYDWTKLDRELWAVRATGARPTLALAMKPPVLYPRVDHGVVHPKRSSLGMSAGSRSNDGSVITVRILRNVSACSVM